MDAIIIIIITTITKTVSTFVFFISICIITVEVIIITTVISPEDADKTIIKPHRNNYYGADTASLSLQNLFQKFRKEDPPTNLGHSRDWNVDLVPKVSDVKQQRILFYFNCLLQPEFVPIISDIALSNAFSL